MDNYVEKYHICQMPYVTTWNEEYFDYLLAKESNRKTRKWPKYPDSLRRTMVELLAKAARELNFDLATLWRAVDIFDELPHQKNTSLVASTCLWIASKTLIDDAGSDKDFYELQCATDVRQPRSQFATMERNIFECIGWDMAYVSPVEFIENWFVTTRYLPVNLAMKKREVLEICKLFLMESTVRHYRASMIAASCIAVYRIRCNYFLPWPRILQSMTRYSESDIQDCVESVKKSLGVMSHPELDVDILKPEKRRRLELCVCFWKSSKSTYVSVID